MSQIIGIFLIFGKFVGTVYGSLVATDFVGLPQDCIFGVFSGDICPKKICFEKICFLVVEIFVQTFSKKHWIFLDLGC